MTATILLVEDDRALREALGDTLELGGYRYRAVDSAEAALLALSNEDFGLMVSDVNMPGMDGHELQMLVRQRHPQVPVLLMTAYGAVERAVEAMRQGAVDYLVKPFEPKVLLGLVARHACGQLGAADLEGPVAVEPASRQLLALAARVARSDSTVLVSGESGTGKEVLARYIHQQSARANKPFIAINCAAIPDNMLEATLFGHEKGAFTGAIATQPGKFELAEGGTLLLDEISEMPLALQAKLLRVLQEREVTRVGTVRPIPVDVRVIAATHHDLEGLVEEGRFRADLYFRLKVFQIRIPDLKDRTGDIPALVAGAVVAWNERVVDPARQISGISDETLEVLESYDWPGNVRELMAAIEHACIVCDGNRILPCHLPPEILERDPAAVEATDGRTEATRRYQAPDPAAERDAIRQALHDAEGNRTRAAAALGMGRTTLWQKLKAYGIEQV